MISFFRFSVVVAVIAELTSTLVLSASTSVHASGWERRSSNAQVDLTNEDDGVGALIYPSPAETSTTIQDGHPLLLDKLLHDVHPLWLRERCQEEFYVDHDTRQPRYNFHEELQDLTVLDVSITDDKKNAIISVTFSDNRTCQFEVNHLEAELRNEVTFVQPLDWKIPPLYTWDKNLLSPSQFDYNDLVPTEDHPHHAVKFLSTLMTTGFAVISNVPRVEAMCAKVANTFTNVRDTNWGETWNVRTTPDGIKKDLAYSRNSIGMHVDNAYRVDTPPAYQLLHALEHCVKDSEGNGCYVYNKFVDGFKVAKELCDIDRTSFDILTNTVVRWENNGGDDTSNLYRYAPMIEVEASYDVSEKSPDRAIRCGNQIIKAINFSAKSGGYAPNLAMEELNMFYQAKLIFSEMLHSDEYTVRTQFQPGDLIMFDNRRLLHSRSEILETDGERWLQGCYANRDGIQYLYEHLRRQIVKDVHNSPVTQWTSLKTATKVDFDRMGIEYEEHVANETKNHLIDLLMQQKESFLGQPVSLMEHNIQTATRALRNGEDDETIVMSLFHDVFETLAVKNHGELAAAMLAPWISPKSQWVLAHHEIFQGYYYYHYFDIDQNTRDMFMSSPYYEWTVTWCELYDQASFDPDYPSLPLQTFLPIVERILNKPSYWWNPSHPKAGAIVGGEHSQEEGNIVTMKNETSSAEMNHSFCHDTWTCYG